MNSRFDYIKYDNDRTAAQAHLKQAAQRVERALNELAAATADMDSMIAKYGLLAETNADMEDLSTAGDKAREELMNIHADDAMQHLEQAYMWCGKALRNQQIEANGSAELQEQRNDE